MEEMITAIPLFRDVGATVVIFLLVWYQNKASVRQHERSVARDDALITTINRQNEAIMQCVENKGIAQTVQTPRV